MKTNETTDNNPFCIKWVQDLNRSEMVEAVAHVVYNDVTKFGECSLKSLAGFFSGWSNDILLEGIALASTKLNLSLTISNR